jgi:putative effector of murein hydrolase LrgA (UPF0299 family)
LIGLVLLILEVVFINDVIQWNIDAWDDGLASGLLVTLGLLLIPIGITLSTAIGGLYMHWKEVCTPKYYKK